MEINQNPGQSNQQSDPKFLSQMEDFFDTYLHKKAPFQLPHGVREWLVQFGPWITLVIIILALPIVLIALGLGAVVSPFVVAYGGLHVGFAYMLHGLIGLASLVMEAVALPGLFKRSLSSWRLVYYATLLSAVSQLVSGNLVGFIIGTAISLYVLFQIKEYYK